MSKETLHEGRFKRFVCEDGWEYVERIGIGGIVAVLPVTAEGEVILVEQYRPPVHKNVIEFPSGICGDMEHLKEESLESAAHRELLEETGYFAESLSLIGVGPSSGASLSDLIHIYAAKNLKKVGAGGGDHTEDIAVHAVPAAEINQWLSLKQDEGVLVDPKVYGGLYLLQCRGLLPFSNQEESIHDQ